MMHPRNSWLKLKDVNDWGKVHNKQIFDFVMFFGKLSKVKLGNYIHKQKLEANLPFLKRVKDFQIPSKNTMHRKKRISMWILLFTEKQ